MTTEQLEQKLSELRQGIVSLGTQIDQATAQRFMMIGQVQVYEQLIKEMEPEQKTA